MKEVNGTLVEKPANSTPDMILPLWLKLMGQYPYGHKFSEKIPEDILEDLNEAANCLAIGAVNAASVMCGRAIERLSQYFDIRPEESIKKKLKRLKQEGHLDEVAFEALSRKTTLELLQNKGTG